MYSKSLRALSLIILLVALVNGGGARSDARIGLAALTVTNPPAGGDFIAEGDDFFTQVLGDPRDMNQRFDLRWQYQIRDITVDNGIWSGTSVGNDTSVWALYPGFDAGAANIGPIGAQYPIDTYKYTILSFRMYSSKSTTQYVFVAHEKTIASFHQVSGVRVNAGWGTYQVDLSTSNEWYDPVYGLNLYFWQHYGNFSYDWVRLVDMSTSPVYEITWSGLEQGTVDIYCDDDRDFSNGYIAKIAEGVDAIAGSYLWEVAPFPPGQYYIYIAPEEGSGAYSPGPLTIVPSPILRITAPSMTSGEDYATAVVGNPWDMDSWDDVLSSGTWSWTWHDLSNVTFDGQMHARVVGPDSFIYLLVDVGNPIDTSKYKYLTWRWYVEQEQEWENSTDRLLPANGWVTRFHYFVEYPYDHRRDMNTLNDIIIWEGWNTYTLDLSEGYLDDDAPGPGPGWTGTKTGLRFDFMEAGSNQFNIHVDYVLLTADDQADGPIYTIQWERLDEGSQPITLTLYYDDDTNPDNGWMGEIGQKKLSGAGLVAQRQPAAAITARIQTSPKQKASSQKTLVIGQLRAKENESLRNQGGTVGEYGFVVSPLVQEGYTYPGSTVQYVHWITNTGLHPDTYLFSPPTNSESDWSASVIPYSAALPAGTLNVGEGAPFTVTVTAPSELGPGVVNTTVLTISSQTYPTTTYTVMDITSTEWFTLYLPLVTKNYIGECPGNCYYWLVSDVPPGSYYICIEAEDAYGNFSTWYSEAPVVIP